MQVALYRSSVTGSTAEGSVEALIRAGTMKIEKIADITLPRRADWLGW
jgi:branched-chain amino acid transport system substrate-binding protein